jgi:hypothetical protein
MEVNQHRNISEIGKSPGGLEGFKMAQLGAEARTLAGQVGISGEEAFRKVAMDRGMSIPEIDAMWGRMQNAEGEYDAKQTAAATARDKLLIDQATRNNILYRTSDRIQDSVKGVADKIARPVNEVVESAKEGMTSFWEEDIKGFTRVDTSSVNTRTGFAKRRSGPEVIDISEGSGLLGVSAGSDIKEKLESGFYGTGAAAMVTAIDPENIDQYAKEHGDLVVLDRDAGTVMTKKNFERLSGVEKAFAMTDDQIDKLSREGKLPDVGARVTRAVTSGAISKARSASEAIQIMSGKPITELSMAEQAAYMKEMREWNFTKNLLKESREAGSQIASSMNSAQLKKQAELMDNLGDMAETLGEEIGVGDLTHGTLDKAITVKGISDQKKALEKELGRAKPGSSEYRSIEEKIARKDSELQDARGELTKDLHNRYSQDIDKARAATKRAEEYLGGSSGEALYGDATKALGGIARSKEVIGAGIAKEAINIELYKTDNLKALSDKDRRLIQDFSETLSTDVSSLQAMGEDTREALGKTSFGKRLVGFGDLAAKIKGNELSRAEMDDELARYIPNNDQRAKLLSQIDSQGADKTLNNVLGSMFQDLAGDKGVAANTGATGQGETNAYAEFAVQSDINKAVLNNMQAMTTVLKQMQGGR